MNPFENLYYALGEMAYIIARADGIVQREEREKFHDLITAGLDKKEFSIDVSEIIFRLMDSERHHYDPKVTYEWAMNEIRMNSHYLSPGLKEKFIKVMEKVAEAYPPVTVEEIDIIDKFKDDIAPIHGDPVYYTKT